MTAPTPGDGEAPTSLHVDEADPVLLVDIMHRIREAGGECSRINTVQNWVIRDVGFPRPRWLTGATDDRVLARRGIWHWPDVWQWARETGRIP